MILENFAHTLQEVKGSAALDTVVTTQIGDLFPAAEAPAGQLRGEARQEDGAGLEPRRAASASATRWPPAARHALSRADVGHEDIAFLQYTGGTTGVSKGAVLTHGNMVANVLQASAWLGKGLEAGQEIVITALPLYHIFSLTGELPGVHEDGRQEHPHHQPARHDGFREEAAQVSASASSPA